eukprot:4234472-Lingulodinium_polyedra.AAC.1
MVHTLVVRGRVHLGYRYHHLLCSDEGAGMGVICIIEGFADPMYVVTDKSTDHHYSKATSG